jgi:hypothetical protein
VPDGGGDGAGVFDAGVRQGVVVRAGARDGSLT